MNTWFPALTWASKVQVPSVPSVAKPRGFAVALIAPVRGSTVPAAVPSKISIEDALP